MDELISPKIDTEKLKDNLLKYFVKVYGEKHREYIKNKLNNCLEIILYNSVDEVERYIRTKQDRMRLELTVEFLRENGIEISNEMEDKIIKDQNSSLLDDIPETKDMTKLYFESNRYGNNEFCGFRLCFMNPNVSNSAWLNTNRQRFLKELGAKIGPDEDIDAFLQSENGKQYKDLIERQKQIIINLDKKYQLFTDEYEDIYKSIDRFNGIKKQINSKYAIRFLSDITSFLTDKDIQKIAEYNSKGDFHGFNRFFYDLDCYNTIFKSLQYGSLIEAFSTENNLILDSLEASQFMKDNIINDRLEYFKNMGLNDDNKSYDELINTLNLGVIPSAERVDKLIECRLKYKEMANDDYFRLASNYDDIEKQFNDMNLAYESDLTPSHLASGCQYTVPNVRKDNLDVVGVVYYSPLKTLEGYADVQFIHEINHVLELNLIEIKNNKPLYKTGFCLYDNDNELSNRELLSETINQDIAMSVTKLMHEDGFYIFDDARYAKIKGSTEYEHNNVIVGDFYNNYRQEIIDSRVSVNLSSLTDVVGEDNFESLNNTVNEFSSLPYFRVMMDIHDNKDTPLRNAGLDLLNKGTDIINLMKSYNVDSSYGVK